MVYKRSKFLINKRFQLKFAFFVCSWIFALSMIYPIIIYNIFEYFHHVASSSEPNMILNVERIKGMEGQVLLILGVLQILFLLITFILSIFLSHRIAGPLFKLRRAIEEVGKGNMDQRITFRKNDHFVEMQDSFNEMIQHMNVKKNK